MNEQVATPITTAMALAGGERTGIRGEASPGLLEGGGYVPLADGRIRADVPFENYAYYRRLLEEVIGRNYIGNGVE